MSVAEPEAEAQPAPFHAEIAEAPDGAEAVWLRADDGVRLRAARLGRGEAGTVLLIPGRTEYIEKYGRAAVALAERGLGTLVLDYRGQGLADRSGRDTRLGHVADFAEYQRDVAAFFAYATALDMPRPWVLLGHSLGGAIGLRALTRGAPVAAAVFSAPMWGIRIAPALRPVVSLIGWIAARFGLEDWRMPGTGARGYVLTASPEDNLLTTDPDMLAYMQRQVRTVPALELGGPSVTWVARARAECLELRAITDPGLPTLTLLPGDEGIVDLAAIRTLTTRWPQAELVEMPGARHEVMMETPERRAAFFDAVARMAQTARAGSAGDLSEGVA